MYPHPVGILLLVVLAVVLMAVLVVALAIAAQHVMSKGREDARLREQKWFVDLTQELYRHAMTRGAIAALQVNRGGESNGSSEGVSDDYSKKEAGIPLGLVRLVMCIAQSLREGVDYRASWQG